MKHIEDNFVTFEIAKELSKIGFDEYCLGGYVDNSLRYPATKNKNNTSRARVFKTNRYCIKAPLWSQAIDWFRNEKNLEINVFKWGG